LSSKTPIFEDKHPSLGNLSALKRFSTDKPPLDLNLSVKTALFEDKPVMEGEWMGMGGAWLMRRM
jgi:hypothetical protein